MVVCKATGVSKRYGEVVALDNMNFSLQESEIHYLVGVNGCGKSTLCKIIAGVVAPDAGELEIEGVPVSLMSPNEAKRRGIAVVYQELSLIPQLSIEENIMLGIEPREKSLGLVDRKASTETALHYLGYFKNVLPLDEEYVKQTVADLPIDEQQIVEIAKALARKPKIIIFDEATASLHKQQVDAFFSILRELKSVGVSTIVISHKMEEITEIGDRVTIMRSGKLVNTVAVKDVTGDQVIHMMVGDKELLERKRAHMDFKDVETVFQVNGLTGKRIRDVSFHLKKGEILGLGGLQGQGQTEVLLALFGSIPFEAQSVELGGKPVDLSTTVKAMDHSLAYISGDRKKAGVFSERPIFENIIISSLIKFNRKVFSRKRMNEEILPLLSQIRTTFGKLSDPANSLSGGNQQKIVIGRWLMTKPAILLLDDSMKGIDVGATKEFYDIMHTLCDAGMSVIWHSSEDLELLNNTDRVLVFDSGQIVDELVGERLNEVELYRAALDSRKKHIAVE
ncbi:MAG: sugar ABC transporter ATP-binding protein [Sphaerochaetaceae bacterium]|jgi:ribose transport system ATP-binding protein|nr:sugar ABC transporter ATP-binding protein [Sphaerochaetaceae bacterium]MDY0371853.1 sugar ABC transporter ATP-binding protein [Sphaerochaetaceae bacterium]